MGVQIIRWCRVQLRLGLLISERCLVVCACLQTKSVNKCLSACEFAPKTQMLFVRFAQMANDQL